MIAIATLAYISSLFAAGVFLLLRRSWFRIAVGIGAIGHAVNLAILIMGSLAVGSAPIVGLSGSAPQPTHFPKL